MSKNGVLISVTEDQEGKSPKIITKAVPFPVVAGSGDLAQDAWGTQKVVVDYSLFHGMFTFNIPPSMWIVKENGAEVRNSLSSKALSLSGRLSVGSGAVAGGTTRVNSRRHPRYQPDRGLKYAASIGFKGADSDGILRAGLITGDENGVYFKTKGDGRLYACVLNNSVETHEELITFPECFPVDFDIKKGNIYDIQMQWRGVGDIKFYAGDPNTGLITLIHKIKFLNTLDEALSICNPAMSISFTAENITQEVSLWCGCVDVSSEGGSSESQQYSSVSTTKTVSSGDGLIAVRSPLMINAKTNTRDLHLARIIISSSKKATIKAYRTREPLAVIGGAWFVVNSGSYVEVNDTMASIDLAVMSEFTAFKIPAGGTESRDNPSKTIIDFIGTAGDYIVMACDSAAGSEIDITVEWGEEI